jgi:hypothetical protein
LNTRLGLADAAPLGRRNLNELTAKLAPQSNVDPFWVFFGYYGLGIYDDALVWLRR